MRSTLLTILLAMLPAVSAAQQPVPATQPLAADVRRLVVQRWNGPNEFRAADRTEIPASAEVDGNVSVLRGPLLLAGHVTGSVLVINGDALLAPTARIDGDLIVIGGDVDGRNQAHVGGDVRIYHQSLAYREDGDKIVALDEKGAPDSENWWQRFERRREGNWSEALRVVQAGPYNRVEGLPVQLGPVIQRLTPWGSVRLDAAAVIRTATSFSEENGDVGHRVRSEVRVGRERGIGVGGQLFNDVVPVEAWQLSDLETALAAFLARRDYRDYYQHHGALGSLTLYGARNLALTGSFGEERWSSRVARNAFSLFNQERDWRPNPQVDEGLFHIGDIALKFDTRTDPNDPWSGWFLNADVERGQGTVSSPAPVSGLLPFAAAGHTEYTRGFFDFRRYNRLGPSAQLNVRMVLGGWLGGDPLPLERRVSVDGPGALPGFGFRSTHPGIDVGNCNTGAGALGTAAQCDRIALGQLEYRRDLKLDFASGLSFWPHLARHAHGDVTWVLFADAGRGWMVGSATSDGLTYAHGDIPALATFRTDMGLGLDIAGVGIYAAKALSAGAEPVNFFFRLKHRF